MHTTAFLAFAILTLASVALLAILAAWHYRADAMLSRELIADLQGMMDEQARHESNEEIMQ